VGRTLRNFAGGHQERVVEPGRAKVTLAVADDGTLLRDQEGTRLQEARLSKPR